MISIEEHSKRLAYTRLVPNRETCRAATDLVSHLELPRAITYDNIQAHIVSFGGGYNSEAEEDFRQFNRDHATPYMINREGVQDPFQDSKLFTTLEMIATLPAAIPLYLGREVATHLNDAEKGDQVTKWIYITSVYPAISALFLTGHLDESLLLALWTSLSMSYQGFRSRSDSTNPELELLMKRRNEMNKFLGTELGNPFLKGIDDVVTICEATHNQFKNGSPI